MPSYTLERTAETAFWFFLLQEAIFSRKFVLFFLEEGFILDSYKFTSVRNTTSAWSEGEKFERAISVWVS